MTVPEVRRLLKRLVWTESQPPDFILYWSWWRRRHQAQATTKRAYHICNCRIRACGHSDVSAPSFGTVPTARNAPGFVDIHPAVVGCGLDFQGKGKKRNQV